jgi:hypothetical protein
MAQIQFKAKVKTMEIMGDTDNSLAYEYIQIPKLTSKHCDMQAFRTHKNHRYSGFANSNMFPGILAGIKKEVFGNTDTLKIDKIPENVTIDTSGFLAIVSIEV